MLIRKQTLSHSLAALSLSSDASLRGIDGNIQSILDSVSKDRETYDAAAIRKSIETLTEAQASEFRRLCRQFLVSSNELRDVNHRSKMAICDLLERQETAMNQQLGQHYQALHRRFDDFSAQRAAVVQSDTEKRIARVQMSLLDGLRFDDMGKRFEAIARPHAKTFHWVFRDPERHQKPWSNFVKWLERDAGVYWVHGKPGSGKSTLMRFIRQNPLTRRHLARWASGARLIQGNFFFWNSGSETQRSHEGLYRTLLYDMLVDARDLLPEVFPEQWRRSSERVRCDLHVEPEIWGSTDQLRQSFVRLVSLASATQRLCFFIDGLDEAEGDAQEIAEFISSMSEKSPHAKFCVSSRSWPVFETIFYESPSLRLQDLTRGDIEAFIAERLRTNKSIQRLLKHEPSTLPRLAGEITRRASGVFLWVSIVVKSLSQGIRDGDDTAMLWRRLRELPSDMEDLYKHIFDSIQKQYPEESSRIFRLFRANGNTLDILALGCALMYPTSHQQAMRLGLIPKETLKAPRFSEYLEGFIAQVTRKLYSRCKGLFEVADDPGNDGDADGPGEDGDADGSRPFDEHPFTAGFDPRSFSSTVRTKRIREPAKTRSRFDVPITYLHRTARDFIEQPEVWNEISKRTAGSGFQPATLLLISLVVGIKTSPIVIGRDVWAEDFASHVENYSRKLDLQQSQENFDLLEELDRALSARSMESMTPASSNPPHNSSLTTKRSSIWKGDAFSSAMQDRLSWYRAAKHSNQECRHYVGDGEGIPLAFSSLRPANVPSLAFALCCSGWMSWLANPKLRNGKLWPQSPSLIKAVLAEGENPRYVNIAGYPLWAYVIHFIHVLDGYNDIATESFYQWLDICKVMIEHGADPHACCLEDFDLFARGIGFDNDDAPPSTARDPAAAARVQHLATNHGRNDPREFLQTLGGCDGRRRSTPAHATLHSFEAVVQDVFVTRRVPGAREFLAVVQEKKKYWGGASGLGFNYDKDEDDSRGPDYPRWVS